MTDPVNPSIESLKAYVMGLAVACPVNQGNPSDCVLHPLRDKSLKERFVWVDTLSRDELLTLANHHCSCMAQKTERPSINGSTL